MKSPIRKGVGLNCHHIWWRVLPSLSHPLVSLLLPCPSGKGKKEVHHIDQAPPSPGTDTSNLKVYDPTSDLKFAWGDFKKINKSDPKSTALPKARNHSSGVVCCLRCGTWFKSKHGKGSCDANRPKDLDEHSFAVPQQLREYFVVSTVLLLKQLQLWPAPQMNSL